MNANFHLEDLAGGGSMRKRGGQFPIQNVQIEKSSFFRFLFSLFTKKNIAKFVKQISALSSNYWLLMDVQRFPAFQFLSFIINKERCFNIAHSVTFYWCSIQHFQLRLFFNLELLEICPQMALINRSVNV